MQNDRRALAIDELTDDERAAIIQALDDALDAGYLPDDEMPTGD